MTCLNHIAFALFLGVAGVDVEARFPFVMVLSERPRLYVWRGGAFCHGGTRT